MKVLVTGANGQLGRALSASAPGHLQVVALTSAQLDISDPSAVNAAFATHSPELVINAAAYTKVDAAEDMRDLAARVNEIGVENLASSARVTGARLVHVSTDFVFDGMASRAYRPSDPTAPLNVYGATKLGGEVAAGPAALIVRTSWLYSVYGNNFVATMLRFMRERSALNIVCDQIGTPTSAASLATALWDLASTDINGVLHYSDSGVASWYDFAVAIMEEAIAIGLLDTVIDIVPIATSAYPTPARRPHFSVLDKSDTIRVLGRVPSHWRRNLRDTLETLKSDE